MYVRSFFTLYVNPFVYVNCKKKILIEEKYVVCFVHKMNKSCAMCDIEFLTSFSVIKHIDFHEKTIVNFKFRREKKCGEANGLRMT